MSSGALIVTGGGRGIGAQIAIRAARAGTPVAVLYRSRPDNAAQVVGEIEASGGRAVAICADVGNEAGVTGAFTAAEAALGPLGALVNNAVLAGPPRRLAELPASELEDVFRTNVFGAFLCCREAARRMSARAGGSGGAIVTLSSAHAVRTGAPGNWVHFAASKACLETMSRGLAKELAADGIRVNVVRPGVIATESRYGQPREHLDHVLGQVPLGRIGEPRDVAAAVLWLLSQDASYVSGATLDVAGGM
ncbi:MAG TPA: SDR family oxidoreductase [Streptosporangiaceae bacterium]|jgi:NAD(P)-dependent dehydrogenase (short-subunit alcohol dehydrogenase family)